MNNWDIYNLTNDIINKEQSGGMFSPEQMEELLNYHSILLLRRKLGLGNVNPLDNGYSVSTHVDDSVQPFIQRDFGIALVSGVGNIPSDYYYHISTRYNYIKSDSCDNTVVKEIELERCSFGEFPQRNMGYYSKPDYTYPIHSFSDGKIYVLPKDLKNVYMTYVRIPKQCQIVYTIDNDGVVTYDEINSVELEWNDDDKMMLVGSILESIGINLRAGDIVNASKTIKAGL